MKNIIKNTIIAGLFLVPFIVFLVPGSMFFPFISGKGFAFRILVDILFGLFILLNIIDTQYRPKLSWITKAMFVFVSVTLVADLLGANPYKSLWSNYERMEGFVLIAHLFLYYIVASSVINTTKLWNWFINTTIFASFLMSMYGVFQLLGWATINQGGVRVDGTLGNAAYFAIYLVFHIFLSIYMFLDTSNPKWQRWSYVGVAVLETVVLYFTATRGAILGIIGGLFITGLLIAWKERENVYIRKVAYWTLGTIVLMLVLFVALRNTSIVQGSPVLSRFATLSFSEFKTQGRYFVWPMAVKGFMERPILGWGQENFNYVFNKYYDPGMYGQEQWFDRTHNIILDWLIAGGIVGLLSYLSILVALMYYIWRQRSPLSFSQKAVLTGMISAYFFHNIFVFDNLVSYILFFTILAYVHSVSSATESKTGVFYEWVASDVNTKYVLVPIVLLFTASLVYFVNIPALLANRTLIQALSAQGGVDKNLELFKKVYSYNSFGSTEATEQLVDVTSKVMSAELPDNIKQEFYNFSKQKVEEKVAQTPKDARYLVFAGSFHNRLGQYDQAIPYLNRAIEESPRKQSIYFELGTSYVGKGDINKMFELFKKAYDLEPASPESQLIYAIGAVYAKNNSVLQQMIDKLGMDVVISDNRFLQAYAAVNDYESVIAILNERIKRDPTSKEHKLNLASTYLTLGQKQNAINVIQNMIKENPDFKAEGEGYIQQINNS